MPRPTRSSNAARKKTLGGSNSSGNRNRTISPSRNKSGTPRKSLRSVKASPAPSVASSASTVSTTAATRSLRKRAPPSPEKDALSTTQASISDGTGFKRRRVSMPPSPDPSPTPAPVKGATPTGRKRRGLQKEASTKRIKPSPQGELTISVRWNLCRLCLAFTLLGGFICQYWLRLTCSNFCFVPSKKRPTLQLLCRHHQQQHHH